eukprot:1159846-Pelagomonas_calceolata.AAC.3
MCLVPFRHPRGGKRACLHWTSVFHVPGPAPSWRPTTWCSHALYLFFPHPTAQALHSASTCTEDVPVPTTSSDPHPILTMHTTWQGVDDTMGDPDVGGFDYDQLEKEMNQGGSEGASDDEEEEGDGDSDDGDEAEGSSESLEESSDGEDDRPSASGDEDAELAEAPEGCSTGLAPVVNDLEAASYNSQDCMTCCWCSSICLEERSTPFLAHCACLFYAFECAHRVVAAHDVFSALR